MSELGDFVGKGIRVVSQTPILGDKLVNGQFRRFFEKVEPHWICPPQFQWQKVVSTHASCQMEWLMPVEVESDKVVLQLHGGGYQGHMRNAYRDFAVKYSQMTGGCVLSVDYRVAPEDPYPAALQDALTGYTWLLDRGMDPSQIYVTGDSAGGGLALALVMYLRDHGMPLPAGLVLMSPWTDLDCQGDSYQTNFEVDPLFGKHGNSLIFDNPYPGEHDRRDPYISPLYGEYTGLPRMLFQVGDQEMLLDDSVSAAQKASEAGVEVSLTIYEGMFHVFQLSSGRIPEVASAWDEVQHFLNR